MQVDDKTHGPPVFKFGCWPEIFGTVYTIGVVTYLLTMARGAF